MAYVTRRSGGAWELRESRSTAKGPRSRTLVSFRTLSDETIERARARATKPLDAGQVREAARRAGAPVDLPPPDRAAGDLLRELAAGRQLDPILRRLLVDSLQSAAPVRLGETPEPAMRATADEHADLLPIHSLDNARASAAWLTATAVERGDALYDLLLLADQLPHRRREPEDFPRLRRAA
jgi:hypothetical protein